LTPEQRADWVHRQDEISMRALGTKADVIDLAMMDPKHLQDEIRGREKVGQDTTRHRAAVEAQKTYAKFREDAEAVVTAAAGDAGKLSAHLPKSDLFRSALLLRMLVNHGAGILALNAKGKK
jgi:hypothetical protein